MSIDGFEFWASLAGAAIVVVVPIIGALWKFSVGIKQDIAIVHRDTDDLSKRMARLEVLPERIARLEGMFELLFMERKTAPPPAKDKQTE